MKYSTPKEHLENKGARHESVDYFTENYFYFFEPLAKSM